MTNKQKAINKALEDFADKVKKEMFDRKWNYKEMCDVIDKILKEMKK